MRRHLVWIAPIMLAAGFASATTGVHADSQTTCDPTNPNCKTVTVDDTGKLTSPTTSGTITFGGLSPSTAYTAEDALEALPSGTGFVTGSYTFTWGTCTAGTASGSFTYTVTSSSGSFPSSPPSVTGDTITFTSSATGTLSCTYTLAYPSGSVPSAAVSVRNDFWVMLNGVVVTQVASVSVPPGGGPPVPEVALAILIPVGLIVVFGGYMVVRSRRGASATA
jgi:hypothetical protein